MENPTPSSPEHTALAAARNALAASRSKLKAHLTAVIRGQEHINGKREKANLVLVKINADLYAKARRHREWIDTGGDEPAPDIRPDAALAQELSEIESDVAFLERQQMQFKAQAESAKTEIHAAEATVRKVEDDIIETWREARAADIKRLYSQLVGMITELRESTPNELDTPLNSVFRTSSLIQEALGILPPRDLLHVPISELRNGQSPDTTAWEHRRAALIAGGPLIDGYTKAA